MKINSLTRGIYRKAILSCAIFAGAFVTAVIASSVFAPVNLTEAEQVSVSLNPTGYYINITSTQDLRISLNSTASGAIAAAKDTLNVQTNVPTGYQLYVSMTNSNADGNRMYLDGESAATAYFTPTSGTFASPAALDMNSWGWAVPSDAEGSTNNFATADKYTTPKPADSATFAAMPLQNAAQLIQETDEADEDPGVDLDIIYAAKANLSQAAGVYQAEITYSLVSEGISPTSDIATLSPSLTDKLTGGETITITTPIITSDTDFGDLTVKIGDADCINPVGSIDATSSALIITCTAPAHDSGKYNAYVYVDKYSKLFTITNAIEYRTVLYDLQSISYMQSMTPEVCASVPTPTTGLDTAVETATLIDTRDEHKYKVAKLKDGNCWMLENLRIGTYGQSITLTPNDSNVLVDYTINSGEIINAPGPNWNSTPGATHVYDRSDYYGNWYNWYTATAGTGSTSMVSADATSSICPKGWKLPSNLGEDSYQNLVTAYGATTFANIQKVPLSFVPAGYYNSGAVYYVGEHGYYWSASATTSASDAFNLHFRSGGVYPQYSDHKYYGFSVRCVAERR